MRHCSRRLRMLVAVLFFGSILTSHTFSFAGSGGDSAACDRQVTVDAELEPGHSDHPDNASHVTVSHCAAHHFYCGPAAMTVDPSRQLLIVARSSEGIHPSRTGSVELHPPPY